VRPRTPMLALMRACRSLTESGNNLTERQSESHAVLPRNTLDWTVTFDQLHGHLPYSFCRRDLRPDVKRSEQKESRSLVRLRAYTSPPICVWSATRGEIFGRENQSTVYSRRNSPGTGGEDHFLTRVLAKPKLLVLGSEDELGKATGLVIESPNSRPPKRN